MQDTMSVNELRLAISGRYEALASNSQQRSGMHTGLELAKRLEYQADWLAEIPDAALHYFMGCGNPFCGNPMPRGARVLDVGCGAGLDSLIAAKMVGPHGWVIGIDMTCAMLEKALQAAQQARLHNLDFRFGFAEELHMPDGWADVVISNGLLSLIPDKEAWFQELARVVKPNGCIQLADVLVEETIRPKQKAETVSTDYTSHVLSEYELRAMVAEAGFMDFAFTWRGVLVADAVSSTPAGISRYGYCFRARKALTV